ncbi:MAG TPA: hypothetical protein VK897_12900 [Anaerolineales bacterium]|nr:hypothetical protein [Anaerolineales bacterium]
MGRHYTKEVKLCKQRFEILVFYIPRQIRILHDEELKEPRKCTIGEQSFQIQKGLLGSRS